MWRREKIVVAASIAEELQKMLSLIWLRISTIPISSTNPATIPKWSRFSTLIAEVMITSLHSRFGFASILIP
jgi:hypothetical protein